ncbi:MAG: PAS domain-containing protein [Proteobacteria bacterium]|nr:PAS domain-containing protein [Desulfobacula sp.]MBU3953530.1 PAS domain-containing protein [Pseudomonadota bacterium]MBU4131665.1 PAS domain-containing protein [Pseudomonadota bacterium]
MEHISFVTSLLIAMGAVIMAFNLKKFQEIIRLVKHISLEEFDTLKHFLMVHRLLIASFLFGYIIVLYAVNSTKFSLGNLFVGVIFLSGATFVLLGIILQKKMIHSIGQLYKTSLTINEKLIRQQDHITNILNSLPCIIVGLNSKGNCTMWNELAERFTAISYQAAKGTHFSTLIPGLSCFETQINDAINGSNAKFESKVTLEKEDAQKIFTVSINPLKMRNSNGVVIRLDDITEKVMLEYQIIQSEKMMSIGGLAAGMAHEINNPLAGIMQNAQLVHHRLTQEIPANEKAAMELGTTMEIIKAFMEKRGILSQLEMIHEAAGRAAKIIANMLGFAKKSNSVKQEHNPIELIEKSIELAKNDFNLNKKYDFKQIQLIQDYSPDTQTILCEESKIQQVLLNLIKNASEAMQMEPIRKDFPKIIFRTRKHHDRVCIEIQDNGPGMDPETQKRIFEPFFTTKGVGQGTGLGLSVSYFIIVDDHGGELAVESIPGKGTTFIIRLPVY